MTRATLTIQPHRSGVLVFHDEEDRVWHRAGECFTADDFARLGIEWVIVTEEQAAEYDRATKHLTARAS